MRLLSVNLAELRQVDFRGQSVGTGIYKRPVDGVVRVLRRTLDGDRQVDLRFHGGVDKAVYCYPHEHYAFWREALGRDDLAPGQFGENFTTEGLLETAVCIGDQLAIGTARFEVTQPRVPCFKLGIKMGDARFVKQFMNAQRTGFYLRVLQEGEVRAGDGIEIVARGATGLSVQAVNHLHFFDTQNHAGIRAALAEPALSASWREELGELLPRQA
jgi:MOSC domain-containing protein YiiM